MKTFVVAVYVGTASFDLYVVQSESKADANKTIREHMDKKYEQGWIRNIEVEEVDHSPFYVMSY